MAPSDALDFTGKTVLVTGGSDGIGYGVAVLFRDAGATVHVTGTRSADAYPSDFSGLSFHTLDVQDGAAIEALAAQFPALDVLANCIGSVLWKKGEFERAGFEKILTINLTGAMHLSTAFLPQLEASGGSIIHLDSVSSFRPALNNPAYSASKAGLMHLSKTLAMKWGKKGVRVNSVAPGMVPTKLTQNQSDPATEEAFKKRNPIPRFGTPADIAGAVLFLASPLASYITGQQVVVDGGLSI